MATRNVALLACKRKSPEGSIQTNTSGDAANFAAKFLSEGSICWIMLTGGRGHGLVWSGTMWHKSRLGKGGR